MSHSKIRNYVKIIEVVKKEHIVPLAFSSSLAMNFHELFGLLRKIDNFFLKFVIFFVTGVQYQQHLLMYSYLC